jgi:hypothetical protein
VNKFVGFLETVGKDFEKGLVVAVKAAPVVDGLANELWPASAAVTVPATLALNLLQNSILSIEQKYAAAKVQNGTGVQKAADVVALAGPTAISLLNQAGVPEVDDTYIQNLIKLLVDLLNLHPSFATGPGAFTP